MLKFYGSIIGTVDLSTKVDYKLGLLRPVFNDTIKE